MGQGQCRTWRDRHGGEEQGTRTVWDRTQGQKEMDAGMDKWTRDRNGHMNTMNRHGCKEGHMDRTDTQTQGWTHGQEENRHMDMGMDVRTQEQDRHTDTDRGHSQTQPTMRLLVMEGTRFGSSLVPA